MKKRLTFILAAVLLAMAIILVTYEELGKPPPVKPPAADPKQQTNNETNKTISLKPGDFFPLAKDSFWKYEGWGNEFAPFTRQVIFVEGNRVQVKEDNGGTTSSSVFEVTDQALVRRYFQGEAYEDTNFLDRESNEQLEVLKAPIKVGTRWGPAANEREIVKTDATVPTPAGVFRDCLKVKISNPDSVVYEYYKQGIGLVKREFISGDTQVIQTLEEYRFPKPPVK